jgi:hypothetical protein
LDEFTLQRGEGSPMELIALAVIAYAVLRPSNFKKICDLITNGESK